jgi:hypothetical protein
MKIFFLFCISFLLLISDVANAQTGNWETLFNGGSTSKLRGYNMDSFPGTAWKVENGALVAQTGVPNIDLVTKKTYKNFELEFEWKVSVAGNSGIFFHMKESSAHQSNNGNSPNWLDNYEMQLLDDIGFNDTAAIRSAGSLYDLIIPQHKHLKPVGEYNIAKVIVKGNHVEHWINGEKVVEYEIGSPDLKDRIAKSKYNENPNFGKSTDGLIMFQHHGQKVWLRNIRVRTL